MAHGRSPVVSGRRRGRRRGTPTPSSRPPAQELGPLPPGTEIEARVDDEGFYGSWYEATVVGFEPASGRCPAQYTVTYSHLISVDGSPEPVAASHVRPRPPPPSAPGSSSSSPPPAPGFLLHDIVEAFDAVGWWAGIVVAPVPDPADPGSPVTVAFPITREVMSFPPHLVRRRRDYVGCEWVPSLSVVALQPKRCVRVYKAGEKVELLRERDAYGESWFPATVAKAVDRLSYIVEYLDEQEGGGKATVYRHFWYIRPAEYHRLRASKVQLGPGTPVEVHCDGAWSKGEVRRVIREGLVYEVSVNAEEAEQLLTKAAELIRPLCIWNGKYWTIPTDKGQVNSRQQYVSRKQTISPVDAASSDDEAINCSLNSCPPLSEKNGLSADPHKILSTCPASKNGLLCTSTGHKTPQVASNHSLSSCCLLSEKNGLSVRAHKIVSACSISKNGLLSTPLGDSAPPDELMTDVIGEAEFNQGVLSEMVLSDGQLETLVYGNADDACDMISTPEVRKQNIDSSLRNQYTQERPFFAKALNVKKGITKNRRGETYPHQGKNDASDHMQIQLKGNKNFSSKEFFCSPNASPECQTTSAQNRQVSEGTSSGSDTEALNFNQLARKEGTDLSGKELAATINRIYQGNRNQDVCTDTAATHVTKSNHLTDTPVLSHDRLVPQERNKSDEGSVPLSLLNAGSSLFTSNNILSSSFSSFGSSMSSHLAFSQISGHQVPFVKTSPGWPLIEAMSVFKEVPQKPHFRPLRQHLPALREGMALGLMVTFASSVSDIRNSSIADSIASFEEKIATLRLLEENGFSVQFLQCRLTKLLQIKSDHNNYLSEKEQLKAQLLEKTTSLSQIDERLEKKEQTIAELEEALGRARLEAQEIMKEKEREDEKLSRLKTAECSVEEACGGAELQFQSVLAELRRCTSLT